MSTPSRVDERGEPTGLVGRGARFEGGRRLFIRRWGGLVAALAGIRGFDAAADVSAPATESRMSTGAPSSTARGAAMLRAVHQIVDHPRVFDDPYALRILEPLAPGELQSTIDRRSRGMRASIALRSRYTEDCLESAVASGTRQYVILGAGLDTFACRNPHVGQRLKVYELDHPATQADKRHRLSAAGLVPQPGTHFVPIDFETRTLGEALSAAGFRFDRPAFFSMLGVSIYITDAAVMATMRTVASCARGSEISMSFSIPDAMLSEGAQARRRRTMAELARAGEPWITFYEPRSLERRLLAVGFSTAVALAPSEANERYFAERHDGLSVVDAHMMLARV